MPSSSAPRASCTASASVSWARTAPWPKRSHRAVQVTGREQRQRVHHDHRRHRLRFAGMMSALSWSTQTTTTRPTAYVVTTNDAKRRAVFVLAERGQCRGGCSLPRRENGDSRRRRRGPGQPQRHRDDGGQRRRHGHGSANKAATALMTCGCPVTVSTTPAPASRSQQKTMLPGQGRGGQRGRGGDPGRDPGAVRSPLPMPPPTPGAAG